MRWGAPRESKMFRAETDMARCPSKSHETKPQDPRFGGTGEVGWCCSYCCRDTSDQTYEIAMYVVV